MIAMLSITGCVDKKILDDVSITSAMGYDIIDRKIIGTAVVPNYLPDKSVKNVNYTGEVTENRMIFVEMQRQSADPLVTGSLEVVLFGEKMAQKKGIIDFVDSLQRDATVGERLYLGVVDGTASDILKQDLGISGTATYISNLIDHNIESYDLPKSNLHLFLYDFFQQGKDPYLPRIKKIGPKEVKVSGISLFKEDKLVDTIPNSKLFFFKLLADKYGEGFYKVKVDGEEAAIHSISSQHNLELSKKKPTEITIHIKIKGAIRAYTGKKITQKEVKMIEKTLEKEVNKECLKLINHFKKLEVDPIGLGNFAKTKTRTFDLKKWEDDYKNLAVKIKTDVTIIEAGVIE
jgi:spore germination protein